MAASFENAHEVFFEQSDPRWGRLPYAGFTVSWAGCGLVAYTMCVDVPYTRSQMEAWLVGAFENRYIIRLASA